LALRHRQGFVKESEEYALEFRKELNLSEHAPLNPFLLAEFLCVPVIALSEHPTITRERKIQFSTKWRDEFSAATLAHGTRREIVHNDSHHHYRQNSNIAHELAHIILGHPPKPPMLTDGCRNFDKLLEREAHDLGFALLVPRPAALYAVEEISNTRQACEHFGVSEPLLTFRIRKTDARRWAQNRARKRFG
jgi:Zn-dependent peptidase ImmA (M78 family)